MKINKKKRITKGICIAFLGPDGSGKTTIINSLGADLKNKFNEIHYFHFRPFFLSKSNIKNELNSNPHGHDNRSLILSTLKIIYFYLDYILGFYFKISHLKNNGNLILFDRYFNDLLIDPRRYRYGGSLKLARMINKFIPSPDLYILLDASVKKIQNRKNEVSLKEILRQKKEYIEFCSKNRNSIVIKTNKSIYHATKKIKLIIDSLLYH